MFAAQGWVAQDDIGRQIVLSGAVDDLVGSAPAGDPVGAGPRLVRY